MPLQVSPLKILRFQQQNLLPDVLSFWFINIAEIYNIPQTPIKVDTLVFVPFSV